MMEFRPLPFQVLPFVAELHRQLFYVLCCVARLAVQGHGLLLAVIALAADFIAFSLSKFNFCDESRMMIGHF